MHRFRPGELVVACINNKQGHQLQQIIKVLETGEALTEFTEAYTPPTVLDARPSERRVEIIASVQENRSRLKSVDEFQECSPGLLVCGVGPNRSSESIWGVVHER